MSYTVYECEYEDIKASETLMIPRGEAVQLWDVKVKNTGNTVRHKCYGLETICPTVLTEQAVFRALSK